VLYEARDGIARHTPEAHEWVSQIDAGNVRDAVADRDRPWQDYGQTPEGDQ